jgi:hypothetical protein
VTSPLCEGFNENIPTKRLLLFLSCQLLYLDNDKFSRFKGCKPNKYVYNALVNVILSCGFAVTPNKVSVLWVGSLECSLGEQTVHESSQVYPDLRPQFFVVGFKNHPIGFLYIGFLRCKAPFSAQANISTGPQVDRHPASCVHHILQAPRQALIEGS